MTLPLGQYTLEGNRDENREILFRELPHPVYRGAAYLNRLRL